ncbi:MAG: nitroreductase family protein [Bacteroidales bacterium]|jgi:nitroreductase|nr:nitroreductase family protein [Bacteroidales bacterium]
MYNAIFSRKSTREYDSTRCVRKKTLVELIRAGMAAPTAKNQQPWVFIAITDKNLLNRIAALLPYAKMLPEAGAAIAVCGDMMETIEGVGGDFWVQDCAAASQNILLAAEEMELGAVWTGVFPHAFVGKENVIKLNKMLNLPGNIVIFNMIAIGYPAITEQPQKPKNKFNPEKIYYNRYL